MRLNTQTYDILESDSEDFESIPRKTWVSPEGDLSQSKDDSSPI